MPQLRKPTPLLTCLVINEQHGNVKWCSNFGRQFDSFFKSCTKKESKANEVKEIVKSRFTMTQQSIPSISWEKGKICPHRGLYIDIHSSIICNGQKMETTQEFINWRVNKQLLQLYNELQFSKKKEQSSDTYNNMNEPQKLMQSETSQIRNILYDSMYMQWPLEAKRLGISWVWEWEWGATANWHDRFLRGWQKCPKTELWWRWHNSEDLLKIIELYT